MEYWNKPFDCVFQYSITATTRIRKRNKKEILWLERSMEKHSSYVEAGICHV